MTPDPEEIVFVAGDDGLSKHAGRSKQEDLSDAEVAAMVDRLRADPALDAVAWTDPVTDAVKEIGSDGIVRASLDRSRLVTLRPPMAIRRTAWESDRIDRIAPM